jgi:hypothetical protein
VQERNEVELLQYRECDPIVLRAKGIPIFPSIGKYINFDY